MRVQALILFISAVSAQHTNLKVSSRDISSPDLTASRPGHPTEYRRDVDELEDASLCFFLREKDTETPPSCKHRLNLRSKFNYNPFGLRFGKRAGEKWRRTRLLPVLLSLRDLQGTS